MSNLEHLLKANKDWSHDITERDPQFFEHLSQQQNPEYLWIGCSDSRVPANQIMGLAPGEVFVHRNISNIVPATDLNCLSVMQFAVDILHVKHIIVCGHYGCGGVTAVLDEVRLGGIDYWLQPLRNLYYRHQEILDAVADKSERVNRLCELNVLQQIYNVCRTTIVQDSWKAGLPLTVHGWVYGLTDGIAHDLQLSVSKAGNLEDDFAKATERILAKCR
jgi:carbonic anhydrase